MTKHSHFGIKAGGSLLASFFYGYSLHHVVLGDHDGIMLLWALVLLSSRLYIIKTQTWIRVTIGAFWKKYIYTPHPTKIVVLCIHYSKL